MLCLHHVLTGYQIYCCCLLATNSKTNNWQGAYWITHNAENPDVAPLQPFNMRHSFTMRAKYADDITYASTSKDEINLTKVTVPGQLHAYNLHVNDIKLKNIPSLMPHLSEEKTLGANVNYLEACSTPKTYSGEK